MDNTAASMAIRIDAEVSGAVSGIKKVEKQLDSLVPGGQAVANVFQRIQFGMLQIVQGTVRNSLVNITSAMKNMVNSGVKVAETLEAAAVGFETILAPGQDVNALLLDIQKNAVKTPFDTDALTLSTQKLALISKNGLVAENTVLDLGRALAAAGRGTAELNRMATNLQQVGTNALITERDIREFGNAGIDITDIVLRFSDAFKESSNEMTKAAAKDWLKSISNPYEVLTDALHKAGESTEGFAGIYEKGASTIKQANENMSDAIGIFSYRVLEQANVLDKVKNVFSELQNNLFLDETFTANTIEAIRHLVDMINELDIIRPIIEGIKNVVSAFATGQFDNVIVFFRELFNAIKQFSGLQVITNAFKVLIDLFSDNHTADEVANVANQIGTLVRYFLELKFVLAVTNYMANFLMTIVQVGSTVMQVIPSLVSFAKGLGMMSAGGIKFIAIGALIVGAIILIQQYGDQIAEVFSNIGQFFANLGSAIGNAVKQFATFGRNIMVGLWNGIAEGAKMVFEQVKNVAIGIQNIFKSIFRIASPSKVMRDEIGRYIDEGIAEGITVYYKDIASAAEEVLTKLVALQDEYVRELASFGALDLVQTVKVYKDFAALYAKGTKARYEMDEKVHDAETSIIKEMINLITDYNKAWDKAYQKAKDYYDMFEYTQATLVRSTKSVIEGLTRQNDNLTKYYNNIAKMSKMGFDDDFMSYIYEQGLDAAAEVAGLADATAEEIEEINNLWATRGKVAADIATLNTKKLKEETLEELDYLQSGLETKVLDYYDTGTYLDYNFTRGIYDMMPTIADAVEAVKSTASGASGAADQVAASVGDLADALAGVEPDEFTPDLHKLEIQAFDTANAFDFLKNMLAGIPWQVWAAAIGILAYKLWDAWQNVQRDVPKAVSGIRTGVSDMIQTLNTGFDNIVAKLDYVADKIGRVSSATYNSAREISNYESVYRQAMDGVFAVTNKDVKGIIDAIDLAKSQGIISTQDATRAIGDIMRNGVEDISTDTRKSLDEIQDKLGVTISTSEHVIEKGLQTIDYKARDIYDQVLYDFTHATEDTASDIQAILDSQIKMSGNMITSRSKNIADSVNITFSDSVKKTTSTMKSLPLFFEHEVGDSVSRTMQEIIDDTELTADKIESAFGKATDHTLRYTDRVNKEFSATDRVVSHSMSTMTHMSDVTSKASMGANKLSQTLNVLAGATSGVAPEISQGLNTAAEAVRKGSNLIDNEAVRAGTSLFDKIKSKMKIGVKDTTRATQESFVEMRDTVGKDIKNVGKVASDNVSKIGENLKADVSKAGDGVMKQTSGIKNKFLQKIANFVADVGKTLSSVVSSVIKIITDIIGNIVDYIMEIIAKITGGIGKALKALLEPLSDAKLLIGVVALVGVAAAIWGLAKACQEFANVRWQDIIKAGIALGIISGILGIIGNFWEYIAIGAGMAALVGVAVAIFGWGIQSLAESIQKASEAGDKIIISGIWNMIGAIAAIGVGLTATMVTNVVGMISGLFALAMSGEVLVIATALAEASQKAEQINPEALLRVVDVVKGLGASMMMGLISNMIGAFSGAFATVVSGELVLITAGLAEACKNAQEIDVASVAKLQQAIHILAGIDFGWVLGNIYQAASSGAMAGVTQNLVGIVENVKDICNKLGEIQNINEQDVVGQIDKVKQVVWTVQEMFNSNFLGAAFQNWSSSQMEGVVNSVDAIMEKVIKIVEKLRKIDKIDKGRDVAERIRKVKEIMDIIQEMFNSNFLGAIFQNWSSSNMEGVANSVDEIMKKVIGMVESLKEADAAIPPGTTVADYIWKIKNILDKIDEMMNGDWAGTQADKSQAANLEGTAQSLNNILQSVGSMCKQLNSFVKDQALSPDQVVEKMENVKSIVVAIAQVNFDQGVNALKTVSEKATYIEEFSQKFDHILGHVQSLCNKLKELDDQDYSVDSVKGKIGNVEQIVWRIAEINFSQEGDALKAVSEKANHLREIASHIDTIVGTVQSMVNKLKELTDQGYNVGKGGEKDVLLLVQNAEKIVEEIAKMQIDGDGQYISEMADKTSNIKNMSENLNGVIKAATEMVENLKKFDEAYSGTTVSAIVTHINDDILAPLMDDPGIIVPYSDIDEDSVKSLGYVKDCIDKINEIAQSLKSVEDVGQQILNTQAIINFIKESLAQLPEAISSYNEDIKSQGIGMANSFIAGWKSVFGDAKAAAHDLQDAMWQELESHMNDELKQGEALAQQLVDGTRNRTHEMGDSGHKLQDALWTAIQNKFGDEYQQGRALAQEVVNGVYSTQDQWWRAGDAVVSGFAGGIYRNMWQINNAAGQMSATAINKLRQLLDIHSPSRVMEDLGANVSEGFADGIIDNLSEVQEAGEALAEAVMDGYNDAIEPINLSAFEARNTANAIGMGTGYGTSTRNTSIVQNNNIYNDMDMAGALSDLVWSVSRA